MNDNEGQDDLFVEQVAALQKQGDKLNNILKSMERNQSQQLQIMYQFMSNMMQIMENNNEQNKNN